MKELLLVAGDGIGREVIPAAECCLRALMPDVQAIHAEAGYGQWRRTGSVLGARLLERLEGSGVALMGPELSPPLPEPGVIGRLTAFFDLFAAFYLLYPASAGAPLTLLVPHECEPVRQPTRQLTPEQSWQATRVGNLISGLAPRGYERIGLVHDSERQFARAIAGGISQRADVETLDALFFLNQLSMLAREYDLFVASAATGRLIVERLPQEHFLPAEQARLLVGQSVVIAQPLHGPLEEQLGWGFANPLGAIRAASALLRFVWNEPARADRLEAAVQATLRTRRTPDRGGLHTMNELVRGIERAARAQG